MKYHNIKYYRNFSRVYYSFTFRQLGLGEGPALEVELKSLVVGSLLKSPLFVLLIRLTNHHVDCHSLIAEDWTAFPQFSYVVM